MSKLTLRELRNLRDDTRSFGNLNEAPFEVIAEWFAEIHAVINRLPVSKKRKQELRSSAADIVTIRVEAMQELCKEIDDILDKETDTYPVEEDSIPVADTGVYASPPLTISQRFIRFITGGKSDE